MARPADAVLGALLGALALALASAAPGEAALDAPTAAPRPQGSVPAMDDTPIREHPADVVDYTLRAELDTREHVVHGSGTIEFRNTSTAPLKELWFHLYLNAFKNDRTVFLRAPVGSGRGIGSVMEWGYIDVTKLVAREQGGADLWPDADKTSPGEPEDQTDIRVPLPRELLPGASLTLEVAWDSKLPSIVERTGYAGDFYMVAQWFPKLARLEKNGQFRHFPFYHLSEFYADFGRYDVTIDVPAGMVVGATGQRVSFASNGGRDVMRYVQADVHDFAFTAWRAFREKTQQADGVAIRALYPPGYDAVADREIATVVFALRYFGERYGRYPYPTLTLVHPPADASEAGGMEYPTLITTGGSWYDPPFLHDAEAVTIHEFGHQYFYGLVATDEQLFPLLDEGINSFAEADGLAVMFGHGSGANLPGLAVSVGAIMRLGSIDAAHAEPVAQPAQAFASGRDYALLVYARTATILETLARVYGREKMLAALGTYARRYRFEHPGYTEFIEAMREGMGDAPAKNLQVALSEKGWVDYEVQNAVSNPGQEPAGIFDRGGKRETVARTASPPPLHKGWALIMRHGTLRFPVDVELRSADGTVTVTSWDGEGDWVRIPYEGKAELASVTVDPEARVIVDQNLFNNGFRLTSHPAPRHAVETATYWAELALHLFAP